jgi:hypothetical protein
MTFSITKENIIKNGQRILKVFEFGAKTAEVISSFGDDSAPLKDFIALYSKTSENGDNVIIGYINKHQLSEPGEKRIFSLKEDGSLSIALHLKNDGTCEFGGNADNLVRYEALNNALQLEKDLINAEFLKIATAINGLAPGAYTPAPISLNILQAKIEEIKTL